MNAWNHLPNAAHIDRIIASAKAHTEVWAAPADGVWGAPWAAAWAAGWAYRQDRQAISGAARAAARYAAGVAASVAARVQAWDATGGAILALVAWDHSAKFLDMTPDELKMWWVLSENPACILLLPAVVAFEKIEQLELV